jgi:hypothetical protein
MNFEIIHTKSDYPEIVYDYVNFNNLDAFHSKDVLNVIYGDAWESLIILNNSDIFLHAFSRNQIQNSEYFDIEPFIGYAGPVIIAENQGFINYATNLYFAFCKKENIIAELFRFNPILNNHLYFTDKQITVFKAKEIIIMKCLNENQISIVESKLRGRIRKLDSQLKFDLLDKSRNIQAFLEMYYDSLNRANADSKWKFNSDFWMRLKDSVLFEIYAVKNNSNIESASIILNFPSASYYFLTTNRCEMISGANELSLIRIGEKLGGQGRDKLILGGGNTSSINDPLFQFKKKFSKIYTTFYMGKKTYNIEVFRYFCDKAIKDNPDIAGSNIFLKYRFSVE